MSSIVDSPRGRGLLPRLFLLLGAFLLLEAGARMWLYWMAPPMAYRKYELYEKLPADQVRVTPHPYLCYVNTPGYKRDLLSHNRHGFRGPDFPLKKPDGVFRIVALGGSTTYTEGVGDNRKTYTAHLEKILREEYGYSKVQVINAGVPGYNSWESLGNLCFRVLEVEPDLVLVYHGANDVHCRCVEPYAYRADDRGRRKFWTAPPVPFVQRYSTLWRIIRRLSTELYVGLEPFVNADTYHGPYHEVDDPETFFSRLLTENPPRFFRDNLRNMIAVARENGVQIVLSSWAWSNEFDDYAAFSFYEKAFRELNDVARDLAMEKEAPFHDFAAEMPMDRTYWRDGRHVNEKGSLLKAGKFARFLDGSGVLKAAR